MIRSAWLSLMLLVCLSSPAFGSEFALQRWLDEPDVKLVAVEFYADWCEPCKKAAPKWEALRKKYAPHGLKLVVVDIGEKTAGGGGRCGKLPWRPDRALCDPELGEALGVKNLPEAFVWSWQGNLLVERGQHVQEIDGIIRRYLDDNPRVQVEALGLNGAPDPALRRQVESELNRAGKLTIVPDAEMKARIERMRKESHATGRRDDQRCALGAEVSPNSLLRVERFEGVLSLSLVDAVTSCQRATASAQWDAARSDRVVQKAMFKLLAQLKRATLQMPGDRPAAAPAAAPVVKEREFRTNAKSWDLPQAQTAMVSFSSTPTGAVVLVDGKMVCQDTSKTCSRMLAPGRHQVTMEKEGYLQRIETVQLSDGDDVSWELAPDFGWITVESEPPGLSVTINGDSVGTTPTEATRYPPGEYKVVVSDPRYYEAGKVVVLEREERESISLRLDPRMGGMSVRAQDSDGNDLRATVFIDGEEVGQTPYTGKVIVGERVVKVRDSSAGLARETVEVEEAEVTEVALTLSRDMEGQYELEDAIAMGKYPDCEKNLTMFYFVMDILPPLTIPTLWGAVPDYALGWTSAWMGTKLAGYGVLIAGSVAVHTSVEGSERWSWGIAGILTGAVIAVGSNFIFLPRVEDTYTEACYKKEMGIESACSQPRLPEPPSFTLAPMVMPTPSGKTAYGLSGGFNF